MDLNFSRPLSCPMARLSPSAANTISPAEKPGPALERCTIRSPISGHQQSPPSGSGWTYPGPCNPAAGIEDVGGVGDAPSIVLPNGHFMLGACCASPAVEAIFHPATLAWTATGTPQGQCQPAAASAGWCIAGKPFQEEQGYINTLLPNDKVLTISVWDPPRAEAHDQASGNVVCDCADAGDIGRHMRGL
jgi:hypothetical protein